MTDDAPRLHWATLWGVLGFILLLSQAVYRLTPLALQPIRAGTLGTFHWVVWGVWMAVSIYSEGYRGFWQNAAPRVVARAVHLGGDRRPVRRALAPFFCMGLFGATKKRKIVSWSLLLGIVTLIILVRQLHQPWRGIIDAGVVVGLLLGLLSVIAFFVIALSGRPLPVPTDVPPAEAEV